MANFSGHIEEKSSWTELFSNAGYLRSDLCGRPLGGR